MLTAPDLGSRRQSAFFPVWRASQTPEGVLTNEHVYSNWTRRFVPRTMKTFRSLRATVHPDRTDFIFVKRAGDCAIGKSPASAALVTTDGCARSDDRARPVMIRLIQGQHTRLSQDHQRIISTWAVIKSMVAEYGDSEYVTTHQAHRKYLMKHHLPPRKGWSVWSAHDVPVNAPMMWFASPCSA